MELAIVEPAFYELDYVDLKASPIALRARPKAAEVLPFPFPV
jgi:hypothetical protein